MDTSIRYSRCTHFWAEILLVVLVSVRLSFVGTAQVVAPSNSYPNFPTGSAVPSGAVVAHDNSEGNAAAIPASFPDKFSWMLFAKVNQKANRQVPINGQSNLISNDAIWETWADDALTFPASPNPANPPQWPKDAQRSKFVVSPAARPATPAGAGADVSKLAPGGFSAPGGAGVGEEVRRNQSAFDYIVQNQLWYQEGVIAFFAKAAAVATNEVDLASRAVNFPRSAIEVKANWIVIGEAEKDRFHWNYNTSGQLLGMVAMHIISKDLPNWFWCTFEHIDNPGRGDFIGIHDSFGAIPSHVPSRTDQLFQSYPAEQQTKEVQELMAKNGFTGAWGTQWKNYRLKGSQVDFTDTRGRPLLLGNSVTEAGFVPAASCITCHARAAVNAQGTSTFPVFGEFASLPLVSVPQQGTPNVNFQTHHGTPVPAWFLKLSAGFNKSSQISSAQLLNLQTDFVWAIPFRAKPMKP